MHSFTSNRARRWVSAAALAMGILVGADPALSEGDIRRFAECISDSGATFYGAHWCPVCDRQKQRFGRSADSLPYVECYRKGTREKLRKCKRIDKFPTWVFDDGSVVTGGLSFGTLARHTGCKSP